MMFMILISRSTGATNNAGRSKVVIKKVPNDASFLSISSLPLTFTFLSPSLEEKNPPIWLYSCPKTIASNLCSLPIPIPVPAPAPTLKNFAQKLFTLLTLPKSHSSAYICSLFVVERKRVIRIVILGESIGSGERAIMCAPRRARWCRRVRPRGVKPPCSFD